VTDPKPKTKRAPRKPTKITDEAILAQRREFIDRRSGLEQAREALIAEFNQNLEAIDKALSECEGGRKFWREHVVDRKYQMGPEDLIADDGSILRGAQ
jgi:hypothetical protein